MFRHALASLSRCIREQRKLRLLCLLANCGCLHHTYRMAASMKLSAAERAYHRLCSIGPLRRLPDALLRHIGTVGTIDSCVDDGIVRK